MTKLEKELTIKIKRLEDDCKAYNFTQHTLQEKIKELESEKDKAWWEGFDTCKAKAGEANVKLSDEITLLKAQIEKMKCCTNCKHSRTEYEHCRTNKHEKWEIKEND